MEGCEGINAATLQDLILVLGEVSVQGGILVRRSAAGATLCLPAKHTRMAHTMSTLTAEEIATFDTRK